MGSVIRFVALGDQAVSDAERVISAIANGWPRTDRRPDIQAHTEAQLGLNTTGISAVVVIGEPNLTQLGRIVEISEEKGLAVVVLVPSAPERHRGSEHAGVIIESMEADPRMLAAELFALCERQAYVEEQRVMLRTSTVAAGGAQGELEKIHEELQLAANTQRDYIPQKLPTWEGIEVGSLFRPAGYVSGDIYDVFELDDRRVGLFIADAMGHGVPAALMTMKLCKTLPKHDDKGDVLPPSIAMEQLNQIMCEQRGTHNRFATAAYAVIDRFSGEAWIASGGHPPVFIVRASGTSDEVSATGPLMGVFDEAEFEHEKITLTPGDSLIMYTDGFETAFPEEGQDQPGRLPTLGYIEQLRRIAGPQEGSSLQDGISLLCDQLDMQAGSLHQADDLTILAARFTRAAEAAAA
ncbi:MAG: SpoIIE family protein phosphatase [Planctomycetota bacterium]